MIMAEYADKLPGKTTNPRRHTQQTNTVHYGFKHGHAHSFLLPERQTDDSAWSSTHPNTKGDQKRTKKQKTREGKLSSDTHQD